MENTMTLHEAARRLNLNYRTVRLLLTKYLDIAPKINSLGRYVLTEQDFYRLRLHYMKLVLQGTWSSKPSYDVSHG
ncbi:hypothetical protein GCM10011571_35230 [Marinithermofilum abyssi]|uniref:HTH merR-type domain-containing protein n=2 Tax=Marinithermofilum abyssi TaxID=1571185 RepID=A0A8J2YAQ8_9BACL|nr:hypothetical protein GCM10011571_35230 [Marinithermofilum abyssi]